MKVKFPDLLIDCLFPKKCLGCGRNGSYFCSSCVGKIEPLYPQIKFGAWPLNFLVSVFPYKGIIRKAIIKLKYDFISDLSEELVELTVRLIEQRHFASFTNLVLIPVPLFWRRKNWRGFNQTELLGEKIARKMGFGFCSDLLIRFRRTKPQVKLKEKERKKNILKAFKVNPKYQLSTINRQSFILFDDVWTTGSTIKECALVLKKRGAKKLFSLTLAR